MHLKPTAGCEISILIFEKKFQKWARTLPYLIYFLWDIYRDPPLHNFFLNIRIDISHPAVGLRCIIPPTHLSQLNTRAIPLT
jgi:hypothetical protein